MRSPEQNSGGPNRTNFLVTDRAYSAGWRTNYTSSRGDTNIRLYPYYEDGQLQPQLMPMGAVAGGQALVKNVIGDFIAEYSMVTSLGPRGLTVVVETVDALEGATGLYHQFYNNLIDFSKRSYKDMSDADREVWATIQELLKGQFPALPRATATVLVRGALFLRDGQPIIDEATRQSGYQWRTILRLSKRGGDCLKSLLTTPLLRDEPLSIENSQAGDLVSYAGGKFLRCFSEQRYIEQTKKNQTFYMVAPGDVVPFDETWIKQEIYANLEFASWDSIIWRPTNVELIGMLAEAFGPRMVWLGLGETVYKGCIPQHIVDAVQLSGAVKTPVPAFSTPAPAPAAAPPPTRPQAPPPPAAPVRGPTGPGFPPPPPIAAVLQKAAVQYPLAPPVAPPVAPPPPTMAPPTMAAPPPPSAPSSDVSPELRERLQAAQKRLADRTSK